MAAVTVNTGPTFNVSGSKRDQFYNISGATGDTLTVGLNQVLIVNIEPGTITGYSVAAATSPQIGQTITFTTGGGAFSNIDIEVIGN